MRQAAVKDIWSEIYKEKHLSVNLLDLSFKDIESLNIGTLSLEYGINILCGANGAGKSTILECINYLLTGEAEIEKINLFLNNDLKIRLKYRGQEKQVGSENFDQDGERPKVKYIRTGSSVECMNRIKEEENFEEYLESIEEYIFTSDDLKNITEIVGKKYESCVGYMIEETLNYESVPFFKVKSNSIKYDSRNMGVGEHSAIYIYYYMKNMRDAIVLLEEPETFLPPYSQRKLIQIICKLSITNKLNLLVTTHSNYILDEIPNKYIKLLRRCPISDSVLIESIEDNEYLRPLGLGEKIKGYILVEDEVAKYFCTSILKHLEPKILKKYRVIAVVGGSSEVAKILKMYKSKEYDFDIIGIFDGDMNNEKKRKELDVNSFKWTFTYLPYEQDLEAILQNIMYSQELSEICKRLYKSHNEVLKLLADIQMYEKHDWLRELVKELRIDLEAFLDIVVKYLIDCNNSEYKVFIKSVSTQILKSENS